MTKQGAIDDEAAPATRNRHHVLVIEDDPAELRALARALRRDGFTLTCCGSGQEAIEALDETTFDCVLSDLIMPGIDGTEVMRLARERDRDLPVILLTGAPSIETAARAVELGAFRYLLKPVDHEDLVAALERACTVCGLARAQRETISLLGNISGERDRVNLRWSFERALAQLWLAFQPIVRSSDGSLYGYEALVRSDEPSLPNPGALLDAAERLGELPRLGRRIRRMASEAAREAEGDWCLFINLHPEDLLDPMLYDVESPHLSLGNRLVFEMTERATLDKVVNVPSRIAMLRRHGVRIAVDDLGAGYAGLASFVQLNPDLVKLDMSLIRDVDSLPVKRRLVESMTSLCRDMNLVVVAEGVETTAERDTLIGLGCQLLQGYLFGRPGPGFARPKW